MATVDASPGELPARPGLRDALVAFRYRNFTLFWVGAVLSNTGTWVQTMTIPFVIFQITGSPGWVGVTSFLQFLPIVVTSPLGGSLADRFDRRRVLLLAQGAQVVVALLLWLAWVTDHRSIGLIIGLVGVGGLITGLNIPSWQAFVSELVPREVLLNAVTLNSTQFNAARCFGPFLGGFVLAFLGVGWAFVINAVSFGAVIAALLLIRLPRFVPEVVANRPTVRRQFVESVRYSRARPGIVACFIAVVALGGLGSPMAQMFVVFAKDVFGVGDVAYGLLGAALGFGAVLASPFIAGPGSGWRRSRLVEVAMFAYGAAVVGFGVAPGFPFAVAALLVAGAGYLALASTLNTTIQLQVDESMRGKVIAVYILLLTAALPVGSLIQGGIAQVAGPRVAVAGFGAAFLGVTAWLRFGSGLLPSIDDDRPDQAGLATLDPGRS